VGPAGRVRIQGRRYRHIRDIQRGTPGNELNVGLCDGKTGKGRIIKFNNDHLEMDVRIDQDPPPAVQITLILALPRPIMLKRILASVTALGVKKIFLIHSRRVEKSFWQSTLLTGEHIQEPLVLGLEQSRDTGLPQVFLRPRFKPFVEDELPGLIRGTRALVAHPEATDECPRHVAGPVTLAIGPEGGWIPYEIGCFQLLGFSSVRLGERILRVETAIPFLLGRLL